MFFKGVFVHMQMRKMRHLPDEPLALFRVLGFLFLVWIPSFFMASGRGTCTFHVSILVCFSARLMNGSLK